MEYEKPTDEIFQEMKEAAINIWKTYDDTYGYASEKLSYVNNINNIADNGMVFYRMFDGTNQQKMRAMVSKEAINYISENQ